MAELSQLVKAFYGRDPIRGEDACLELLKEPGVRAVEAVVPYDGIRNGSSRQAELRLKQLASALDPQIVAYLVRVIESGPWTSKVAASRCFAGLKCTEETMVPLIGILQSDDSVIEARQIAIEALGFLGADEWASELEAYVKSGSWGEQSTRHISEYHFEKLSSYVLEAFFRFAARANEELRVRLNFYRLTEFIKLEQQQLPGRARSSYASATKHFEEFTPACIDWVVENWSRRLDGSYQELSLKILRDISSVRTVNVLLDLAISSKLPSSIRRHASIALGEIRHPQAAARLAEALQDRSTDRRHLDWAFSTLYAVPFEWPDLSDYVEEVLSGGESEPANQLCYSLALRGDDRCRAQLIDRLDDAEPCNRWTAALSLSRLLGPDSRHYLEHRAEEAGDDMERCGMLAASIRAGDIAKVEELHAALQVPSSLPELRTVWKIEILDTFRTVGSFDRRAFPLWSAATRLGNRSIEYFDNLLPQRTGVYSCFISYSSRDQDFAGRLHADLQNKGVRCWFAPHDMAIGAKILDAIDEAIRLRDKVLLILSEGALASDWVEGEVTQALEEERERGQVVLFPIRIDNTVLKTEEAWARLLWRQRNIGDFTRWQEHDAYQKALERLLRDLKVEASPAPDG